MENPIAIDRTPTDISPGSTTDISPGSTADTFEERLERIRQQRVALRLRHSQALARLMEEREDLRGVHALADFVDDSLRWSA